MSEDRILAAMNALEEFQKAFEKMDQAFRVLAENNDGGYSVLGGADLGVENALNSIEEEMENLDVL